MEKINNYEVQNVTGPQVETRSHDDGRLEQKEADLHVFTIAMNSLRSDHVEERVAETGVVLFPSTR